MQEAGPASPSRSTIAVAKIAGRSPADTPPSPAKESNPANPATPGASFAAAYSERTYAVASSYSIGSSAS
eukprot:SAG31_NODE_930_length_10920_cov_4.478329_3_plen_70_part_00